MGWGKYKKKLKKLKKPLRAFASGLDPTTSLGLDKIEGAAEDLSGKTQRDAARSSQRQQRSMIARQHSAEKTRLAEAESEVSKRRLIARGGVGRRSLLGG